MGEHTKIEWADHTFNPWIGCQHVSPGCINCYAETLTRRWKTVEWGPHGERKRTSASTWHLPIRWNERARREGKRARVFCASLADWLDNKVPKDWRTDLAALIAATPNLDYLLLTKRIENFHKLAPWLHPPCNVWLGVTAEDQQHFDRRIQMLLRIPASVHFVSYEPAIGPLRLRSRRPEWIICGGETGAQARMMQPEWARALRDECARTGVAFFLKQMTVKADIPDDLLVRQFPRPRIRVKALTRVI